MQNIEINHSSGCCFGVERTIARAEKELQNGKLYCLGEIIHNDLEIDRLAKMGLMTVTQEKFENLHDTRVLFRAHGEPPISYEIAEQNNIEIIDTTCPVVLNLQKLIRDKYHETDPSEQIAIYGQKDHAEVVGLVGQTEDHAVVIENTHDIDKLDRYRNTYLFSQTTKSHVDLQSLAQTIKARLATCANLAVFDTICGQIADRAGQIGQFAQNHDLIIFIAGEKSSNGKTLFEECKTNNPNSHFISRPEQIDRQILGTSANIGICGATSTPRWQMEAVAQYIVNLNKSNF